MEKNKKHKNKKKNLKKIFGIIAVILGILGLSSYFVYNGYLNGKQTEVSYVDFIELTDEGKIDEIQINKDKAVIHFEVDGKPKHVTYPATEDFVKDMMLKGISVKIINQNFTLLLTLGQFLFILIILLPILKQIGDPDIEFNTKQDNNIKFSDVAGMEEIKNDLTSIIDMFTDKKYADAGVRIPKGILLEGNPGNGKTLLAKAFAGEADVNFMAVNASDIGSKFVSVSAQKVKKLFKIARENAPCILFIDEIDSVGAKRTNASDSVSKEMNSTLTALLNQMDGFEENSGVLVLAATNRSDVLDDALLRPGRFDKKFIVSNPDRVTRKKLFEFYLKDKEISNDVTYEKLSNKTQGCSSAEIATIVNEAVINSVKNNRKNISLKDFDKAIMESAIKGHICKEYEQTPREKKIIAYHEAGHALINHFYCQKRVSFITTQPTTSGAGGFTITESPKEELMPISDIEKRIVMCYGGRAAEIILANNDTLNVSAGASQDVAEATKMALHYIPVRDSIDYSQLGEMGNKKLSEQVERLLHDCSAKALTELQKYRNYLDVVAKKLIENDSLSEEEFLKLVNDVSNHKEKEANIINKIKQ